MIGQALVYDETVRANVMEYNLLIVCSTFRDDDEKMANQSVRLVSSWIV